MSDSNTFTRGINTDLHPKFQEEGTYRFALNAVLETKNGEIPSISNEESNNVCATSFPSGKKVIGHALTETDDVIVFLYDRNGNHEIGKYSGTTCKYETLVIGNCLNFSQNHPINAIYRVRNGCDGHVYFTDNYNDYRVINISDLDQYLGDGLICPKLEFSRDYSIPTIDFNSIQDNSGGNLQVGVYYFAVRFLDKYNNATNWTITTRPVVIGNGNYGYLDDPTKAAMYTGGSNIKESDYYVKPQTKSILLDIVSSGNLFDYYQVAVIKRTTDEGNVSSVDVLQPKPWTSFSETFEYTGNDNDVIYQSSLDDILNDKVKIKKVGAHAFDNNRLFLGNTSGDYRDYSKYQRYASKVKTEFYKPLYGFYEAEDAQNKEGVYYFDEGSFMEDEVYALGIVYVFQDGTESPVFHIPGRPVNPVITGSNPLIGTNGVTLDAAPWDTGTVTMYGDNVVGQPRWKQISTAAADPYAGFSFIKGLMGYHETENYYPYVETCDNHVDGYWGRDYLNNLIDPFNTKIRHHRMPGSEIRDDFGNVPNFKTGVRFSNITYPQGENIVGHYFVYGDRTFERTVLAKGVFVPLEILSDLDKYAFSVAPLTENGNHNGGSLGAIDFFWPTTNVGIRSNMFAFISSETLYKSKRFEGSYVKFEKIYLDKNWDGNISSVYTNSTESKVFDTKENYVAAVNSRRHYRYFRKYETPISSNINHTIENNLFIDKTYQGAVEGNSVYENITEKTFVNNSVSMPIHLFKLTSGTEVMGPTGDWRNKAFYGSVRVIKDVFSNLFTIQYKRISNKIDFSANSSVVNTHMGGDTSVGRLSFLESSFTQKGIPSSSQHTDVDVYTVFFSFPTQDTYFNPDFRSSSLDQKKDFFKYPNADTPSKNLDSLMDYLLRKLHSPADKEVMILPETYHYNDSFSYLDSFEIKYPVPFSYKFCNLCIEDHPYRLWYSQKDDNTSLEDKSRIILPNNYTDELGGTSGPITDLFVSFNKLYATTPKSVFYIPTRPQSIESNVNSIYIGTGEVLGVPPQELKNSVHGFGGQEHWSSRLVTEHGAFYMDSFSGTPMLLSDSVNDLSLSGLRNFFQENGEFEFPKEFKQLTNQEFPYISHASSNGFGYKSVYDPRYKRLILTKRDFKFKAPWQSKFIYFPTSVDNPALVSVPNDRLWFNGHSFYYKNKVGTNAKISFEDGFFFENKSFTLSYSFLSKHWVSFHSYLPTYTFSNSNSFFSQQETSSIYKHGGHTYLTFFDIKYPHIIDVILSKSVPNIKTASNVNLFAYTSGVDANLNTFTSDVPYSAAIFYNSSQSSGAQPLIVPGNFVMDISNGFALTKITDREWRINNIRDITISNNLPIWASDWGSIGSSPFSYIDKVPNPANIDYAKSFFTSKRLKDYYLGGRFIFNANSNVKVTLDLITTTNQNNQR
jgi:hypothetical protein